MADEPQSISEARRALLAEHRRYCADFYCTCRDDDCCEDCTDDYHAPMCPRWEP